METTDSGAPENESEVKMKHPKTCNGCKALYQSQVRFTCELGYELKITKNGAFKGMDIVDISPKNGECPKPLTIKELLNAPNERKVK